MAMLQRYNSPPNWPTPPPGWAPPPNWRPDPAWGPPPPNWPFWVSERANPRAWALAFAWAGGFFVIAIVVALTVFPTDPATQVGIGVAQYGVAGLFTGLIGWNTRTRWRLWVYPLVVLGFTLAAGVLMRIGQMNGS